MDHDNDVPVTGDELPAEPSGPVELERLTKEVADLRELITSRLLDDRQRQQMYDELYRQLEFARKGLVEQFLAPIVRELLLVMDRIDAMTTGDSSTETELGSVRDELGEILLRHGVRRIDPTGERFDPRVHEAVGREPVSEAARVGSVVQVRRPGYALADRLLRPAQVIVGHADRDGR
ncbi:MAG TPA: nucleotide exchange factor GrpE [Actinopolymorphaceae bacterium]